MVAGRRPRGRRRRRAAHRRPAEPAVPRPGAARRVPGGRASTTSRPVSDLALRPRRRPGADRRADRLARRQLLQPLHVAAAPATRRTTRPIRPARPARTRRGRAARDVVFRSSGRPLTAMDWEVDADGLPEVLRPRARASTTPPPLYVTENGAAYDDVAARTGDVDDADRIAYLDGAPARRATTAIAEGVDLRGYFALVAAGQLRVGLGLHQALRHRPRRLRDPGAHAEGQRALVPRADGRRLAARSSMLQEGALGGNRRSCSGTRRRRGVAQASYRSLRRAAARSQEWRSRAWRRGVRTARGRAPPDRRRPRPSPRPGRPRRRAARASRRARRRRRSRSSAARRCASPITGSSQAIASRYTRPNGSSVDGATKQSAQPGRAAARRGRASR